MHLAHFVFRNPHQLVIELDGFERLDEQCLPGAAGAVNHAVDPAPLAGDDRHHEAVVANGDVILLHYAFFAVIANEALKRILNRPALPLHVAAQPAEQHAGVVGNGAVRQDLARQVLQQRPELAHRRAARAELGEAVRHREQDRAHVAGPVEQLRERQNFQRFERRALDAQLSDRCGGVRQRTEAQPHRRAARSLLRSRGRAQILDSLGRIGERALRGLLVQPRLDPGQLPQRPPRSTR